MSILQAIAPTSQTGQRQLSLFPGPVTFRLVDAIIAGKAETTQRTYTESLEVFRRFTGHPDAESAVQAFIKAGRGPANALALAWKSSMLEAGLSPGTVNLRLSVLRTVVRIACKFDLIGWTISVEGLRQQVYRDTRGPGTEAIQTTLAELGRKPGALAARNRLMVSLMYRCGLRRGEVIGLDLEHVDLEGAAVWIRGKGFSDRQRVTVPPNTLAMLKAWLEHRGDSPGPLFPGKVSRLTGRSVWDVTTGLGLGHPHGMRHSAVTRALVVTGGDITAVQRFSRHSDPKILLKYNDNLADQGGAIATMLDAE